MTQTLAPRKELFHPPISAFAQNDIIPEERTRPRIEAGSTYPQKLLFEIRDKRFRITFSGDEPNWLYDSLGKLRNLALLPENWDSNNGLPTSTNAIYKALEFMSRHLPFNAVAPSIVPVSDGGLQLEWHPLSGDLEICFDREGKLSAAFGSSASGEEWEMDWPDYDTAKLKAAIEMTAATDLVQSARP